MAFSERSSVGAPAPHPLSRDQPAPGPLPGVFLGRTGSVFAQGWFSPKEDRGVATIARRSVFRRGESGGLSRSP